MFQMEVVATDVLRSLAVFASSSCTLLYAGA